MIDGESEESSKQHQQQESSTQDLDGTRSLSRDCKRDSSGYEGEEDSNLSHATSLNGNGKHKSDSVDSNLAERLEEFLPTTEGLYKACKFGNVEKVKIMLERGVDPNDKYQNNFPICVAAHKGFKDVVELLIKYDADVNAQDMSEGGISSTIAAMRRTTLNTNNTPLNLAIKYGHSGVAVLLIENGADALNDGGFEKSPLQEAIRLYRTECLQKICTQIPNASTVLLEFKKEIFRQCLVNDNVEALRLFVPMFWSRDNVNSDFLITVLNNLMLKNKVQTDKAVEILDCIMEAVPMNKLKLYDVSVLIRFFLRLLPAQFLSISDERIMLLLYRSNMFFIILKYMEPFNFEPYLPDLDFAFMTIFDSIRDTGENKIKVLEFMMNFYDNLIVTGHLSLTPDVIRSMLNLKHVIEFQKIQDYLCFRATRPLMLKEQCRLALKDRMEVYKRNAIDSLPCDQTIRDYVYFLY